MDGSGYRIAFYLFMRSCFAISISNSSYSSLVSFFGSYASVFCLAAFALVLRFLSLFLAASLSLAFLLGLEPFVRWLDYERVSSFS